MELSNILLIVLGLFVILHFFKKNGSLTTIDELNSCSSPNNKNSCDSGHKRNNSVVDTRGLKLDKSGLNLDTLGNFPIPPTSSESKALSENTNNDLTLINNSLVANPSIVNVIRSGIDNKESHYPKYYRKDLMSGNTIGTTEHTFAGANNDEPSLAWADLNVSDYPKYYKSDFEGGLTNVGSFFDQSNKYVDITGPRTDANVGDVCYKDKDGTEICLENDKLINVAPHVVDNKKGCGFMNNNRLLQFSNLIKQRGETVSNGSIFYDNVKGNNKYSIPFDTPIKDEVISCEL